LIFPSMRMFRYNSDGGICERNMQVVPAQTDAYSGTPCRMVSPNGRGNDCVLRDAFGRCPGVDRLLVDMIGLNMIEFRRFPDESRFLDFKRGSDK
jgi:hypothetical protein